MNRFTTIVKKLFFGEALIARVPSKLNNEIKIYEDLFCIKRLQVGELTQSGGEMNRIMKLAFNEAYRVNGDNINNILMFGLGAGTWIKKARKYWPKVRITVIEFDPTMVQIAKKYFSFDKHINVELKLVDAFIWLEEQGKINDRQKYDLIVVDLYSGMNFPTQQTKNIRFVDQLKHLINENGLVAVNRLNWGKHYEETDRFQCYYEEHFNKVWNKKTLSNRLIFCHF